MHGISSIDLNSPACYSVVSRLQAINDNVAAEGAEQVMERYSDDMLKT